MLRNLGIDTTRCGASVETFANGRHRWTIGCSAQTVRHLARYLTNFEWWWASLLGADTAVRDDAARCQRWTREEASHVVGGRGGLWVHHAEGGPRHGLEPRTVGRYVGFRTRGHRTPPGQAVAGRLRVRSLPAPVAWGTKSTLSPSSDRALRPSRLIPGGPVILGYDADRPWQPTSDELEDWEGDREFWFGPDKTIQECLAEVTLRPRLVEFAPFLIETTPKEDGWEPIGLDDPIVQQIIHDHGVEPYPAATELGKTRVSRNEDGSILAERCTDSDLTHADLAGQLAVGGFRFPTSDEWEYACGAGDRPCSDGATTSHAIGQFACPVVSGKTHREVSPTAGISTSIPTHSGS